MLVIDGHIDFAYHLHRVLPSGSLSELDSGHLTPAALHSGGLRMAVSALYTPDAMCGPDVGLEYLRGQLRIARTRLGLPIIGSAGGLARALNEPAGCSQLLLVENADPLLDADLGELFAQGVRLVGLTHVGANRLGSGNADPKPGALTPAGCDLVPRLALAGFILDLAHLHKACFAQTLDLFSGPICCTHTGLRRFFDVPRNLDDDQVKAIAAREGVIGLTFAPEVLRADAKADLESVFEAIDTVVALVGPKYAALGSDFGGYDAPCVGLPDAGAYPALFERMQRAGYRAADIQAIAFGNWRRFFLHALPDA